MSAWLKPPILTSKTIDAPKPDDKSGDKSQAKPEILHQTVNYGIENFKLFESERVLAERCYHLDAHQREEDMVVWMRYYHPHLKHMYGIFLSGLSRFHIKNGLSFDEFRLFAYNNTIPRLCHRIHKRIRPLI